MSSKTRGATKDCLIYTRISKADKEDEAGVKRQEKECRALAQRLGWSVSRVYSDNDLAVLHVAESEPPAGEKQQDRNLVRL